jgi:hypothetical protein
MIYYRLTEWAAAAASSYVSIVAACHIVLRKPLAAQLVSAPVPLSP